MKRRRLIAGIVCVPLLGLLAFWLLAETKDDTSKVSLGFAGHKTVNGVVNLVMVLTNGSSYRIEMPEENYSTFGQSTVDPGFEFTFAPSIIACGLGRPGWGLWQLEPPDVPCVKPGEAHEFLVPVGDKPYNWQVTATLRTITFKERLPYALKKVWPSSKRNEPISFEVRSPWIPALQTAPSSPPPKLWIFPEKP